MKRNTVVEIIAAAFILLFVYTASSKFLDFDSFKWVLNDAPLTKNWASAAAWIIPITELVIAIMLFFPRTKKIGLWSSFAIMVIFTAYIGYMLYFTPDRPCNCGGVISKMTWNQHFLFNILFTLLAGLALWINKRLDKQPESKAIYSATA